MKILVACDLSEAAIAELRALGSDVIHAPELTGDALAGEIGDVSVLIVDHRRVSPEVFAAGHSLQLIVRGGTDTSNIAIDDASAAGVFVTNCPNTGAVAAAELAFGFLIALDRGLPDHSGDLRQGVSRAGEPVTANGLAGTTLGIVGYGPVAQHVVPRARAFGMDVLVWLAPRAGAQIADPGTELCVRRSELLRRCRSLMIFAPPESCPGVLLDSALVAEIRDESRVVFIGHAGALDERALAKAIAKRGVRVAIDARPSQAVGDSVRFKSDLFEQPGVIGTRSVWNTTKQAREAAAREILRVTQHFLVTGEALNCVNLIERSPATWQLVLRLRDVVGVLASVMDVIRADGINAEEITTRVFHGARAAWCLVALDERPSTEALDGIAALEGVLHLELRAMV